MISLLSLSSPQLPCLSPSPPPLSPQVFLESSAVLAVVVFGFNLNLRRSAISPEVLDFLHEFYEVAAFMFNTIIFNIAGFKLGLLFVDYSTTRSHA